KGSVEDRLKGILAARETRDELAKSELLKLLKEPLTLTLSPPRGEGEGKSREANTLAPIGGEGRGEGAEGFQRLYSAAVQGLSAFDGDEIAHAIVEAWKNFPLPTRRAAAEVLVTRNKWSRALLAGVDQKIIEPQDVSATARRALARSSDS